jgi:hypothetical protein
LTIARMPARIAWGSSGHAATVVPIARAAPRARQGTLPTGLRVAGTLQPRGLLCKGQLELWGLSQEEGFPGVACGQFP